MTNSERRLLILVAECVVLIFRLCLPSRMNTDDFRAMQIELEDVKEFAKHYD